MDKWNRKYISFAFACSTAAQSYSQNISCGLSGKAWGRKGDDRV